MNAKNHTCAETRAVRSTADCDCQVQEENTQAQAVLADVEEECCDTVERRATDFSESVCIDTNQVYDSCRDRVCVTDGRVYLSKKGQKLLECAINVKLKSAEIIWVFTEVEPLSFNRGYFSVDLKFFIRTTLEIFTGVSNPSIVYGLTTYDKRVILFGSEGNTKSFTSKLSDSQVSLIAKAWQKTNMPTVTVETVDPVSLSARIEEESCCDCNCDCDHKRDAEEAQSAHETTEDFFPAGIAECFSGDLVVDDCAKRVLVTYGLFFLVRLERDSQLLVDAEDFCIPTQECDASSEENPCSLFHSIRFPVDEFFPPRKEKSDGCGCHK